MKIIFENREYVEEFLLHICELNISYRSRIIFTQERMDASAAL